MKYLKTLLLALTVQFFIFSSVQARPVLAPMKDGVGGGGAGSYDKTKIDISTSQALINKIEKGEIKKPGLKDLIQTDSSTNAYSLDEAASLGFSIGATDAKYSRRIFIKNFIMYKEYVQGEAKVRYGIGVRWIVNVKTIDANAKLTGIPAIAAAADAKSVEATAQFQVYGMSNPEIATMAIVGSPSELTLDTYGNMYVSFQKIIEMIKDPKTVISPILIAAVVEKKNQEEEYSTAVAISWALTNLSQSNDLNTAQNKFPTPTESEKDLIKMVYEYYMQSDFTPFGKPDNIVRERAKKTLKSLKLK